MAEKNDEQLLKKLTPDTLKVYNYLIRHNPNEVTLEQLSKGLGLTKPTILHHLEKLKSLDLVEQTVKGYKVKEIVKIAIIKGYTHQLQKVFLTWVPLTFIFLTVAVISTLTITEPLWKIVSILACISGILISIREVKQLL